MVLGGAQVQRSKSDNITMRIVRRDSIQDDFQVNSNAPIPEIPTGGARVKVCFAGACYTDLELLNSGQKHPRFPGSNDTSLFSGYEVSGVIDELCNKTAADGKYAVNDRVIVYPCDVELFQAGYAEYITVKDVHSLVKIPDSISLEMASLFPCGGLTAYSAIVKLRPFVREKLESKRGVVNMVIVGAGGLGLWTLRLAKHLLTDEFGKLRLIIADPNIDKLLVAEEHGCHEVMHWDEKIHEGRILERTKNSCRGGVDIVVDFVSSPRTIKRSLKVLNEGGIILVGGQTKYEMAFDLSKLAEKGQTIMGVNRGTREQLQELVDLFAEHKLMPPCYRVFPVDEANEVFRKLSECKLNGRAVLRVCSQEDSEKMERVREEEHQLVDEVFVDPKRRVEFNLNETENEK